MNEAGAHHAPLARPLRELEWLPPQRVRQLERFELATVGDLLTHFPRRYEDRTQFDRFPQQESDTPVCVCGIVKKTAQKRLGGWKSLFEVVLEEEQPHALSEPLVCRWFNVHFVQKMIATGQRLVVFGKPKLRGSRICIDHPDFEIVENDEDVSIHLKRIAPIYPATEGLSQRVLRRRIYDALAMIAGEKLESRLPAELDSMPFGEALRAIHFPKSWDELAAARRHLVLGEFFAMQVFIGAKRAEASFRPGQAHCGRGDLLGRFHAGLPFPLTNAQRRTIEELRSDLAAARPMNRLLHGDVGSGKTVVALSAMLLCVESGHQAALMAPTQILAEQHYLNFKRWLEPLGISVALRTGARSEESGPLPLFERVSTSPPVCGEPPQTTGGPPVPPGAGAEAPATRRASAVGGTGGPPVASGGSPDASETNAPAGAKSSSPGARYWRRNLPHFERPWAKYALHFRTFKKRPLQPEARQIILDCILHWNARRYTLYAACVMPDHVHLLIEPAVERNDDEDHPVFFGLTQILQTIKSFTAHEINKLERRNGPVWHDERYDRYIRSDEDMEEKFGYICQNPWTAGIVSPDEDYPWVWYPEREFLVARGPVSEERDAGRVTQRASGPFHPAAGCASPHITVGTHALLYEGAEFSRLGLVVIDEQHKFGVMQRARLIEKGAHGAAPDVLVMTATPIPRTLTMTVYGDLDVSTLDEMPANRGKIVTALRDTSKLPEAADFIRKQLDDGRQAYIVYPLIEESGKLDAKAAAAEFKKWEGLLNPMRCELLHGRVEPDEKDAIMERFRRGETKALIATSVIEVGIDVPNANVMLIENAERFGLAQLHQLRGRIGRGEHKSYCILISSAKEEAALEKLRTLERTADGFEIAEADLRLRGPGDILGTAQSGLPPLKIGDLLADADLMRLARQASQRIFEDDPALARPENERFRELLVERRKLMLSQIS